MTLLTLLTPAEVQQALNQHKQWQLIQDTLERTIVFPHFLTAIAFVNAIAQLAERQQHHPDMDIRYTKVTLRYSTHDSGGLTVKDIAAIQEVDAMVKPYLKSKTTA